MKPPKNIKNAAIATWLSIVINLIVYGVSTLTGAINTESFLSGLLVCGLFCAFPMGFLKGHALSRFLYTGIAVPSYLFLLYIDTGALSNIDFACLVITAILDVFSFYNLFSREASEWFAGVSLTVDG